MATTKTHRPTGQRKAYSGEIKNKAIQSLHEGGNPRKVASQLGVSMAVLLGWKGKTGQPIRQKKTQFDAAFKARALQKLDGGQSLRQVSKAMGVSSQLLNKWWQKRQGLIQSLTPGSASNEVNQGVLCRDGFPDTTYYAIDNKSSFRLVTNTSSLAGSTLHRLSNQPPVQELATRLTNPLPGNADETRQRALDLLNAGQSVMQVARCLSIPPVRVRRWWLYRKTAERSEPLKDGRRIYDDAFKRAALQQIDQGVSVRQLAKSMGVTEVTLHKWRKKVVFEYNSLEGALTNEPLTSTEPEPNEPSVERIAYLEQKLRQVEQERDTLKKAIRILMRTT